MARVLDRFVDPITLPEHASDCDNHKPIVFGNTRPLCSCGAYRHFRIWDYDICRDQFRWAEYTRESAVAAAVCFGLSTCYGSPTVVRLSTLMGRALALGLTGNEKAAIASSWEQLLRPSSQDEKDRGFADRVVGLDLSPLDGEFRAALMVMPDEAEIAVVTAPMREFWATLPEPSPRLGALT